MVHAPCAAAGVHVPHDASDELPVTPVAGTRTHADSVRAAAPLGSHDCGASANDEPDATDSARLAVPEEFVAALKSKVLEPGVRLWSAAVRFFEIEWLAGRVVPGLDLSMVKLPFTDGPRSDGKSQYEYMWIGDVDFDGDVDANALTAFDDGGRWCGDDHRRLLRHQPRWPHV